jgi:secreted PhoX family phosphatase
MGYKTLTRSITITPENKIVALGTLTFEPEAKQLEGVTVVAERSTIEQKIDRKVVNVGRDLTTAGATASDIMNNIPSVNVDQDGKISLRGNENVRVLVDGKPTNMDASQLLKQIPSTSIKKIELITKEALIDLGIGVISVRRNADGKWERTNSQADRRVTGISGLEDGRYLKTTGPAVAIFQKKQGLGYTDSLGDRVIGTFNNCAGGTTPWGTVFSAEENFQNFVPEPVMADGTSLDPSQKKFSQSEGELNGLGNVFGLAGNKYGWMVEIDPANVNDYGTKHTWLGRYRHEAVGIRAEAGKNLVFYSGCDRRGGHLYKFVSEGMIKDPQDKNNSKLLESGMLYAAKFNEDGTGNWIPLKISTPINPHSIEVLAGKMLPLPQRPEGGILKATKAEERDIAQVPATIKIASALLVGGLQVLIVGGS